MKILAEAEANAAISILHALGLGKGCSVGIDLKVTVRLVSEPQEIEEDFHSLLQSVVFIWSENDLPLPDNFGWQISSNIPIGQGLKSSSAISCAALKSLNIATWAGLNDSEIINLSVSSQRHAGCTVTGSMDDSWASISSGWKLVDPQQPAEQSVLIKGEIKDIWKSQNLIDTKAASFLNITLDINNQKDLLDLQKALNEIDLIENHYVSELNKNYVKIKIKYLGKIDKIKLKFQSEGIKVKIVNNEWKLRLK